MFPAIKPDDVGITGLAWLFLSYGYVLYYASNLIGEGSELLLLIPSMAGLVGGLVLPLLGAVPDGAIILFSGLGSIEEAQESLSVGVGALAGSTIMLLTIPLSLSIYAGRVDLDGAGHPCYQKKPKLTPNKSCLRALTFTGVTLSDAVREGGKIMMITTIPYFVIQIPALFLHGPAEEVAQGEKWYALIALIVCLVGLVYYMRIQLRISKEGLDKGKRLAVMKKLLKQGKVSLAAAIGPLTAQYATTHTPADSNYHSIQDAEGGGQPRQQQSQQEQQGDTPPPEVQTFLVEILKDAFFAYDSNGNGLLDKKEAFTLFKDFNENIPASDFEHLFQRFDESKDGNIDFKEFIGLAYVFVHDADEHARATTNPTRSEDSVFRRQMSPAVHNLLGSEEEEEEMPEELTDLPPDQQQAAIKRKAFIMLFFGTILVVLFSDPMVDVMQEIAVRINISPFYVSFVLAPLASNASEFLSSMYYAGKKTTKTITVSVTALEGAASMNNTICLSIFMFLIFFRGLAWQYTAETIAIVIVEVIIGLLVQRKVATMLQGVIIGSIFPLSILLVAVMEHFGLD